jgi:pimeloyl-ACP methyl ester carboxylesterase/DNA-binding CsgD family transcriptional regulator
VQYTRTADDISLAYGVGGEGLSVTLLPFHFSNIRWKWVVPRDLSWNPGLRDHYRVLSYDSRGQGLSTRQLANDPTPADYLADLETVLAAAGVERTVLIAYGGFGHVAARFAVEHPEMVDALVLLCTCESFSAWPMVGMMAMAEENWDLFVDMLGADLPPEARADWPRFVKACVEPGDYIRLMRAFARSSVSDLLHRLDVPTLVLHSLDQHWLSLDEGTRFASQIKGARLLFLDGAVEPNVLEGVLETRKFLASLGLGAPLAAAAAEPKAPAAQLTGRQSEVYALLAVGRTNREIGAQLFLSERTVERHISDLYGRLGVRNRAEAVALASRV